MKDNTGNELTRTYDPNVFKPNLYPLSALSDYEVADKNPDVRGWDVLGNDGVKFGKVHELIVDLEKQTVRYLDIDINKKVTKELKGEDHEYEVLIPVGLAILNRDDKNVIIPQLNVQSLAGYPLYERTPIYVVREYETAIRSYFTQGDYPRRDPDFYSHEHFDVDRFYR